MVCIGPPDHSDQLTDYWCPAETHRTLTKWFFVIVHSLSHIRLFVTPWTTAYQASLSFTISQSLLKLISFELVMPSNHLILCRPLLLPSSVFPSLRVFSDESVLLIRWPKYWSFSLNISPSNESSGLISFRMDWLDLLAVQRTLKSLLQHHRWTRVKEVCGFHSLIWMSRAWIQCTISKVMD